MTYTNGDTYSGSWKSGRREGFGEFISVATSSKLVGEWSKDEMTKGTIAYASGDIYEGTFLKGQRAHEVNSTYACRISNRYYAT